MFRFIYMDVSGSQQITGEQMEFLITHGTGTEPYTVDSAWYPYGQAGPKPPDQT